MKFKFISHTADIKFQAFGKTKEEVFKNSALAIKKIMSDDKIGKKIKKEIDLHLEGVDLAGALQNFLEEFLFLFETEYFILNKIKKIKIEKKAGAYFTHCEVFGDKAKKYKIQNHIKAITHNELFFKKTGNKFISQVVVDV